MPKLSDIETTFLSPLYHVNALLDEGPDWNYLTPMGNTILYTFSVASGNEVRSGTPVTGQQSFSISQQFYARSAMDYISKLTGIVFQETGDGASAQVHLANLDIASPDTVGLCSWNVAYSSNSVTGELVSYQADAYVYLDNREFAGVNANLAPGGNGYETLLHELGHMLGLKHPHEDEIQLSPWQDNTSNTLMSYDHLGGPYAAFSSLDIAALDWLYGRDGLRGALGVNSATGARYLTGSSLNDTINGTQYNDTLRGEKGNDMLNGGDGTDTAVFSGNRAAFAFNVAAGDTLLVSGPEGSDTLASIELFQFFDGTFTRSQLVDNSAPATPTVAVEKNDNGYVKGNTPIVFGVAEAGSTVKVFNGANQVATGKADITTGLFQVAVPGLANGSYVLATTATDAAGNVSAAASVSFRVDATAPGAPSGAYQLSGNQASFSGAGEAGTSILLVNNGHELIGETTVDATGKWTIMSNPLANGSYSVSVQSVDDADNVTAAGTALTFSVNSVMNATGGNGNDLMVSTPSNNALQGLGGIDTAVYAGPRSSYTVAESTNGYTVSSVTDGLDSLLGIERIKFGDASVAIDIEGNGGQAYRLYSAVLARAPDLAGLGYWIDRLDDKIVDLRGAADYFLISQEFTDTYGAIGTLDNSTFVSKLYQNVLHRPLDQAGFDFWVVALEEKGVARSEILVAFSESAENKAQVIGVIENGAEYIPYIG